MKKLIFIAALASICLTGCNQEGASKSTSKEPKPNYVDIFVFSGQSNMSGAGEAKDALPVIEGNGYEYLSVTGSDTKGYVVPAKEPFGVAENNSGINDGSNKTGGMVSSFIEGYYRKAKVPIIGVSASRAGKSLHDFFKVGTAAHTETIRRLKSCVDYVNKNTDYIIRHINMLWCQGCSDASEYYDGTYPTYFDDLDAKVHDLQNIGEGYNIEKCYVVLPSEYTGGKQVAHKKKLADDYIKHCNNNPDDYFLATTKTRNVPAKMRQDPHFHQGIYNVIGYDAGLRVGAEISNKNYDDYEEFVIGEDVELAEMYGINLQYKSI